MRQGLDKSEQSRALVIKQNKVDFRIPEYRFPTIRICDFSVQEYSVEPSEVPEVTVEPSEVPEEVVTEEPVEELSREPIQFETSAQALDYMLFSKLDDIVIYDSSSDGKVLTPYYNGDTIVNSLESGCIYICYPGGASNITISNAQLDEECGKTYHTDTFCDLGNTWQLTENEDITITVSYDDGRNYEMTVTIIAFEQ